MILLTIDIQTLITTENLYNYHLFKENTCRLIAEARKNGTEVIYARHDDGPGTPLTAGTPGYEIHKDFAPLPGEQIFNKTVNSPFRDTNLLNYLRSIQETTLIVTGLQTDLCIDATIKTGFEHGFQIIVPAHTNTTVDNPHMTAEQAYKYYNEFIWPRRYASCIPIDQVISLLRP